MRKLTFKYSLEGHELAIEFDGYSFKVLLEDRCVGILRECTVSSMSELENWGITSILSYSKKYSEILINILNQGIEVSRSIRDEFIEKPGFLSIPYMYYKEDLLRTDKDFSSSRDLFRELHKWKLYYRRLTFLLLALSRKYKRYKEFTCFSLEVKDISEGGA